MVGVFYALKCALEPHSCSSELVLQYLSNKNMSYTPPTPPFPFEHLFMNHSYYTGFTQAGFTMTDLDVVESGATVYWYGNVFTTTGNNQKVFHNKAMTWLTNNGYTANTPLLDRTINKYKTTFNNQIITGDTYNDVCNLVYSAAIQLTPF